MRTAGLAFVLFAVTCAARDNLFNSIALSDTGVIAVEMSRFGGRICTYRPAPGPVSKNDLGLAKLLIQFCKSDDNKSGGKGRLVEGSDGFVSCIERDGVLLSCEPQAKWDDIKNIYSHDKSGVILAGPN